MKTVSIRLLATAGVEVCPFCTADEQNIARETPLITRIRCDNCGALGPIGITEREAVDLWNACTQDKQKEIKLAVETALATQGVSVDIKSAAVVLGQP